MKLIIVVFFIFVNFEIFSQDKLIQLPDNLGGPSVYRVSQERLSKKLQAFEDYKIEELTTNSKWWYHLTVSSCKLYLDRDSSLYHFNEAFRLYPKGTCENMRIRHNYFYEALEKAKETGVEDGYVKIIKEETGDSIFSWYLWDLPDFDEFAFIESCNLLFPPKEVEPIVKDSTLNSEIIRRRDQKYRSIGDLEKQKKLDQINRDFIDSLYLMKGSIESFDEEEIEQFSWVAHHSDDCDWAYKWMERLIEHSSSGYKGRTLLGPLLERMLRAKEGYCTKQDAQKRDYFVYMIKDKYPEFVEKNQQFGW